MAVTTEAGDPSAVSANEIRVMIEAIRYINTTLECASQDIDSKTSNEARNVRVGLLRNIMSTGGRSSVAARRLLEWIQQEEKTSNGNFLRKKIKRITRTKN